MPQPTKSTTTKNAKVCCLCGKKTKLIKTDCCDHRICDDSDKYILFSYARNSCQRNHDRYTLCSYHHNEGHKGDRKECKKCRNDFDDETYAYYASNECNWDPLKNPPSFTPQKCHICHKNVYVSE